MVQKKKQKQKQKPRNPDKLKKLVVKPVSLIDEKADWNGTLFPFRGTAELYGGKAEESDGDFDDGEWLDETSEKERAESPKVNNSLGALMSAYNSSDESGDEVPKIKFQDVLNETNVAGGDDDVPVEVKIAREPIQSAETSDQKVDVPKNRRKRKRGKQNKVDGQNKHKINRETKTSFIDQPFKRRRITLLERLLDSEIRHERNVLLQCVRFVVENDYFKKTN